MPLYAKTKYICISGRQLRKITRNRNPFKDDSPNYNSIVDSKGYKITQKKDGSWWVLNYRAGAPLFAPDYWWRIPDVVAERAKKIEEFVESL